MNGLFSSSYYASQNGQNKLVKKPIHIIYNENYCLFYVDGKSQMFKTHGYKVGTQGDYIHTGFASDETEATKENWYLVIIDEGKEDNIFQVSLPNGFTYVVQDAERYSENGKVKNAQLFADKKKFADMVKQF